MVISCVLQSANHNALIQILNDENAFYFLITINGFSNNTKCSQSAKHNVESTYTKSMISTVF